MSGISFRLKLLALVMAPILSMFVVIATVVVIQSDQLSSSQEEVIRNETMASKKQELLQYMDLALRAINPIYEAAEPDDESAKQEVIALLNNFTFGEDGYFFVYTYDGFCLVLPYQDECEGVNRWEVTDSQGFKLLQALIKAGQQGGGFVEYRWHKPSLKEPVKKLSYAVGLEKWGWMIGTGIYIDDIDAQIVSVHSKMERTISKTFIGLTIALIITVGIVVSISTTFHVNARELADKKLQALNRQIIDSQEEERTRVSRELHDGINQILVSVKYRLDNIADAKTDEERNEHILLGQTTLNEAVTEVRRISKNLRPALLDDLGLLSALDDLSREVSLRSGVTVLFEHHLEVKHLSKASEITLFRVAQEALHNVEKHASANAVDMMLQQEEDEIILTIADDGIGFNEPRESRFQNSMGLKNMRERIENLDGQFLVSSLPEKGTEIRAVLPKSC